MSYTAAWILWLLMFAAIEGSALLNKAPEHTLTAHIWDWFDVRSKPAGWNIRRGALAVFLGWLLLHLTGIAF